MKAVLAAGKPVAEAEAFLADHRVDVLITSCWNGFKRTIYIPGHENEWMRQVTLIFSDNSQ